VVKALVAASVAWPLFLAGGTLAQIERPGSWPAVVTYIAGGAVCHQRDERSFHSHGTKWPVCARCSGLYLTAPVGAIAALLAGGRLRQRRDLTVLAVAASATAFTFLAEHSGAVAVSSPVRFVAALPLGAAAAWVVTRAVRGPETGIG
jgi:uncharacterized membrane protein